VTRLGNPCFWATAYQQLETLHPSYSVSVQLLNFFLASNYHTPEREQVQNVYVLDSALLAELKGLETDGHVLRKAMGFKLEGNILILKPLLIIIEHQNQYFLAMFDYVVKKVLILGRSRDPTWQVCANWTSWNGYTIWKSLGKAFGWKIDSSQPAVYEAGWITVSDLLIAKI